MLIDIFSLIILWRFNIIRKDARERSVAPEGRSRKECRAIYSSPTAKGAPRVDRVPPLRGIPINISFRGSAGRATHS